MSERYWTNEELDDEIIAAAEQNTCESGKSEDWEDRARFFKGSVETMKAGLIMTQADEEALDALVADHSWTE